MYSRVLKKQEWLIYVRRESGWRWAAGGAARGAAGGTDGGADGEGETMDAKLRNRCNLDGTRRQGHSLPVIFQLLIKERPKVTER